VTTGKEGEASPGLEQARKQYARILLTERESIEHAVHGLGNFGPSLPRSAKRVLASVRLQLLVLKQRNLLRPDSPTIGLVAKWANLADRWPGVAALIRVNPLELENFERRAQSTDEFLETELADLGLTQRDRRELHAYLRLEPRFGDACWTLVRLEEKPPPITP
jgi:hypothetical protein